MIIPTHRVWAYTIPTIYKYRYENLEIILLSWENKGDEIEVEDFKNVIQLASGYFKIRFDL